MFAFISLVLASRVKGLSVIPVLLADESLILKTQVVSQVQEGILVSTQDSAGSRLGHRDRSLRVGGEAGNDGNPCM